MSGTRAISARVERTCDLRDGRFHKLRLSVFRRHDDVLRLRVVADADRRRAEVTTRTTRHASLSLRRPSRVRRRLVRVGRTTRRHHSVAFDRERRNAQSYLWYSKRYRYKTDRTKRDFCFTWTVVICFADDRKNEKSVMRRRSSSSACSSAAIRTKIKNKKNSLYAYMRLEFFFLHIRQSRQYRRTQIKNSSSKDSSALMFFYPSRSTLKSNKLFVYIREKKKNNNK